MIQERHRSIRWVLAGIAVLALAGAAGLHTLLTRASLGEFDTTDMSVADKDKVADTLTVGLRGFADQLEAAPNIVDTVRGNEVALMKLAEADISALHDSSSSRLSPEKRKDLETEAEVFDSAVRKTDDMLADALGGKRRVARFDEIIKHSPCLDRPPTPACDALAVAIARYSKVRQIAIDNTDKARQMLQEMAPRKEALRKEVDQVSKGP